MDQAPGGLVQFGAFELDRDAGQLTRSGRRVHLAPQAVRVLSLLTARAGSVVTREEIRSALWGDDTFVDFDTAVNACVSQIRTALGDKPTAPRFIETLPRRGYRLVAPVVQAPAASPPSDTAAELPPVAAAVLPRPLVLRRAGAFVLGALGILVVGLLSMMLRASAPPPATTPLFAKTHSLLAIQKLERGAAGLADASPGELLDRVRHFEAALAAEPDFAEAYSGLAEAKLIIALYRAEAPQVAYPAAKAAAAKALSLNPELGTAHAYYAAAVLFFEWDWDGARAHFARALELAPESARVHYWYARYLTARGRHPEAVRHALQAVTLAPTSPSAVTNAGIAAFYAGRLDESGARCRRAAGLMPEFLPAHTCVKAVAAARDGRGDASPDGMLEPAVSLAANGQRDRALDWLQLAANRHSDGLVFAGVQPAFAPLHGDPRFTNLLERIGLRPPPNPSN